MPAKITPIKSARRAREVEITKLFCDCSENAWLFRVTVIGDQVSAECQECLQEWGPFYVSQTPVSVTTESSA